MNIVSFIIDFLFYDCETFVFGVELLYEWTNDNMMSNIYITFVIITRNTR